MLPLETSRSLSTDLTGLLGSDLCLFLQHVSKLLFIWLNLLRDILVRENFQG